VKQHNESLYPDTAQALLLSKADGLPPLSADGQVVLKITRMAHSQELLTAILESPKLESCRVRVAQAGCEISPDWGNGAKFLVPFTECQHRDLVEAGKELESHHIVALQTDVEAIKAAFASIPSRRRPRIQDDEVFFDLDPIVMVETWPSIASSLFFEGRL